MYKSHLFLKIAYKQSLFIFNLQNQHEFKTLALFLSEQENLSENKTNVAIE